jgi:hypothetical protein
MRTILTKWPDDLAACLDAAVAEGERSRSAWIRDAVYDALQEGGWNVPMGPVAPDDPPAVAKRAKTPYRKRSDVIEKGGKQPSNPPPRPPARATVPRPPAKAAKPSKLGPPCDVHPVTRHIGDDCGLCGHPWGKAKK